MAEDAPRKTIHEVDLSVHGDIEGDFKHWLPQYLKELLELPGFLGGKVLRPSDEAGERAAVVFVLGGPGAGKGTQCARIVENFGYVHLSAGDLLRAERTSGSAQGQLIDDHIKNGTIVPVEITCRLLVDAIRANGGKRFLVDGFPRNTNNLSGWHQVVGDQLDLAGVLVYDCPEQVLEERLLKRGETSGRADDNIESIRKRFHTFQHETMPVLAYYDHQGIITSIDGTRPVEDVWVDSKAFIEQAERRLTSPRCSYRLHLYVSEAGTGSSYITNVPERIAADAARRWGEGAVRAEGSKYSVQRSFKAFELESLRAFD